MIFLNDKFFVFAEDAPSDKSSLCVFDKNPCKWVESCDDVLAYRMGLPLHHLCSRAVIRLVRKPISKGGSEK